MTSIYFLDKVCFKYHTRFDTANDKWNAISSTICFDDMLNYFLQQTIYYPKLMVTLLHLTSLIYLKPWQTDKFQIEILKSRKKSFHLINPCQCPSHYFHKEILNCKNFVCISHHCINKKILIMLPLSDLQSLNEYIILRKMSEFKSSYGIF